MKVATLHKSPHFNHTVALDTFYLEWDKEKRAVLAILDEFSCYEVDCEIKVETAEMEIGLFESVWAKPFGYPKVLRMDASGPHQGEYAEWASLHGIKLELIPQHLIIDWASWSATMQCAGKCWKSPRMRCPIAPLTRLFKSPIVNEIGSAR